MQQQILHTRNAFIKYMYREGQFSNLRTHTLASLMQGIFWYFKRILKWHNIEKKIYNLIIHIKNIDLPDSIPLLSTNSSQTTVVSMNSKCKTEGMYVCT